LQRNNLTGFMLGMLCRWCGGGD